MVNILSINFLIEFGNYKISVINCNLKNLKHHNGIGKLGFLTPNIAYNMVATLICKKEVKDLEKN